MFKVLLVSSALTLGAAAMAEPLAYTTTEQAFETNSDLVLFPASIPGTLTARGCPQCPVIVLEVDADTTFLAGKVSLSAAELKKLATNQRNMAIFYDPNTKKAGRVVVYGVTATSIKGVSAAEKRS